MCTQDGFSMYRQRKSKKKKKKDKLKGRAMLARLNTNYILVSLHFTNFPLFLKVKNGFLKVK